MNLMISEDLDGWFADFDGERFGDYRSPESQPLAFNHVFRVPWWQKRCRIRVNNSLAVFRWQFGEYHIEIVVLCRLLGIRRHFEAVPEKFCEKSGFRPELRNEAYKVSATDRGQSTDATGIRIGAGHSQFSCGYCPIDSSRRFLSTKRATCFK
jgi:hypothetical protein